MIGVECVSAFAADSILQLHMMQAGVLWHLLLFLFYYDFTLDEGGVEKTESSNQQVRPAAVPGGAKCLIEMTVEDDSSWVISNLRH